MNDSVGHNNESEMSLGLGHSPKPTSGTSVGVLEHHTPWSTGFRSRSLSPFFSIISILLAPDLLSMRGMARGAKKVSE